MAPFFSPLAVLVGGSVAMIFKRYFRRLNLLKVYLGNAAKKGTKIFATENLFSRLAPKNFVSIQSSLPARSLSSSLDNTLDAELKEWGNLKMRPLKENNTRNFLHLFFLNLKSGFL